MELYRFKPDGSIPGSCDMFVASRYGSLPNEPLPFGAHVAGFVSAVGSVSVSRNGNEMLSFRINDTKGNSLQDGRLWGGRASA